MTVNTQGDYVIAEAEAGVPIAFNYPVHSIAEIVVTYGINNVEANYGSHYTIDLDDVDFAMATVTPTALLLSDIALLGEDGNDDLITIRRVVPLTQPWDIQSNNRLPERDLERALDRLTLIAQQLQGQIDHSFGLPYDNDLPTNIRNIPFAPDRLIGYNGEGEMTISGFSLSQLEAFLVNATTPANNLSPHLYKALADAVALVPAAVSWFQTSGRVEVGDPGAGTYDEIVPAPGVITSKQVQIGDRVFELRTQCYTPEHFGAYDIRVMEDSPVDHTLAIKECVETAFMEGKKVIFRPGRWNLAQKIRVQNPGTMVNAMGNPFPGPDWIGSRMYTEIWARSGVLDCLFEVVGIPTAFHNSWTTYVIGGGMDGISFYGALAGANADLISIMGWKGPRFYDCLFSYAKRHGFRANTDLNWGPFPDGESPNADYSLSQNGLFFNCEFVNCGGYGFADLADFASTQFVWDRCIVKGNWGGGILSRSTSQEYRRTSIAYNGIRFNSTSSLWEFNTGTGGLEIGAPSGIAPVQGITLDRMEMDKNCSFNIHVVDAHHLNCPSFIRNIYGRMQTSLAETAVPKSAFWWISNGAAQEVLDVHIRAQFNRYDTTGPITAFHLFDATGVKDLNFEKVQTANAGPATITQFSGLFTTSDNNLVKNFRAFDENGKAMLLGRPLDFTAARRTTDQAITTEADVIFNVHDGASLNVWAAELYNSATGVFTCRIAGRYVIDADLYFDDVPTTTMITCRILAGATSIYAEKFGLGASPQLTGIHLHREIRLAAGDTIRIKAALSTGTKNIKGSTRAATFDVRLLRE